MKTFILVITLLTNDGRLETYQYGVDSCPDRNASAILSMNELVKDGMVKAWTSTCIQNGRKA